MAAKLGTIVIDGERYYYTYTDNNVHIMGSYNVRKRSIEGALLKIEASHFLLLVWQRSIKSLKREWATHNLCYSLGIARSRTKDVDLNYPNKWEWLYNIVGTMALWIIK